ATDHPIHLGKAAAATAEDLAAPLFAVAVEIENGRFFFGLQQAETPRDLLIGFLHPAEILAEAVLVELLARLDVPQATAVGTDLVGEDDPGIIAFPDATEFQLEVDQPDADRGEHTRQEV